MTDVVPLSKRPVFIVSVLSLVLTLTAVGYYFYQKHIKTQKNTEKLTKQLSVIAATSNLPKTPSAPEVLSALFGVKITEAKVNNAVDQLSSLWFEQSFAQGKDNFHAVFVKSQTIDPDTKAIADSHADGANISVVVYKLVDKQWQFFSKQLNVGSFGAWGDVPETKSVPTLQLSPDNIAFLIASGSSGQGYTEEGKGLFSFNSKDKSWKDLGFVQTGGDNAGACDDSPQPADSLLSACWKFTGEITLAKSGKNRQYPDLLVIQKGTTSDDNNKVIPASNRSYVFNGEQYVEPGAESR